GAAQADGIVDGQEVAGEGVGEFGGAAAVGAVDTATEVAPFFRLSRPGWGAGAASCWPASRGLYSMAPETCWAGLSTRASAVVRRERSAAGRSCSTRAWMRISRSSAGGIVVEAAVDNMAALLQLRRRV